MIDNNDEKLDNFRNEESSTKMKNVKPYTWTETIESMNWTMTALLAFFHIGFILSCIVYIFGLSVPYKWLTIFWAFVVAYGPAVGVTAGAHRLWSHRSYKANLRMRIILMIIYSVVGMNPIFHWVRDHRVHHKYSETDADPHNAKRGFFFSHIGWLLVKRHPEFLHRAKEIDLSDILADPVVMFNKKYAIALQIIFCFAIPVAVPILLWDETITNAILTQCFIRYVIVLNSIWCVNSVAHLWGTRPYNRLINPAESPIVSLLCAGEGSHNYHHTFPWDYKASEWPYFCFNTTTLFINGFARLGWAYGLREPSREFVEKVVQRVGYKSKVFPVS